jgi:hypothetical protein
MSQTIDINGVEYLLGATVGPVSGTGGTGSYFLNTLLPGFTYSIVLTSYNNNGYSGYVGPIEYYVKEGPFPNPPKNVSTTRLDIGTLAITFEDQSNTETGFKIFYHRVT